MPACAGRRWFLPCPRRRAFAFGSRCFNAGRANAWYNSDICFPPGASSSCCCCSRPCSPPAPAAPVRLVVWGMESSAESKDMDAKIAVFEQRHPDIKIAALSMGAGAMNPQKLMTAIVGGVPPDLVQQDRFTIGDWASRDAFRPLDDLLQADARSSDPLAIRQKDYVPATWAETVYKGHVYAIPNSTDDRVLFYNRALFREAGLDPDKPPQTWDELIADAKASDQARPERRLRRGWASCPSSGRAGSTSGPGRRTARSCPPTAAAAPWTTRRPSRRSPPWSRGTTPWAAWTPSTPSPAASAATSRTRSSPASWRCGWRATGS